MRPLIEILEDERMTMLKLDHIFQHMSRTDDLETLSLLKNKKNKIERELNSVRDELRGYFSELF